MFSPATIKKPDRPDLRCILASFLMYFSSSVAAQAPVEGCIIGETCSPDQIAEPSESQDFVTIAIADSLGDKRNAIEAMLRADQHVRISPSLIAAEYIVARHPDFPDTLVLIDRKYHFPSIRYRYDEGVTSLAIAHIFDQNVKFQSQNPRSYPIVIGSLDSGAIADDLSPILAKILHIRRLLALGHKNETPSVSTRIDYVEEPQCPTAYEDGRCFTAFRLTTENSGATSKFVYVLQTDSSNNVRLLLPEAGATDVRSEPGASTSRIGPDLIEYYGEQYFYVTIASDNPIDRKLLLGPSAFEESQTAPWSIDIVKGRTPTSTYGGGGVTAAALSAPWQVELYSTEGSTPQSLRENAILKRVDWQAYEKIHRCGGTLIAADIVLTAAHCVANRPFDTLGEKRQSIFKYRRIKLGTQNLKMGGTTFAIDSVVVHRDYKPGGHLNDIALIRIKPDSGTIARNAARAKPIALASTPIKDRTDVSWYGWGVTEEVAGSNTRITSDGLAQRNPVDLRTGQMEILDRADCKKRQGYGSKVTGFMLCAITPPDSVAAQQGRRIFTCLGDSGGPVVAKENGRTVQVGIISWAVGCGANDNPSVSAYIYRYRSWINIAKTKFISGKSVTQ